MAEGVGRGRWGKFVIFKLHGLAKKNIDSLPRDLHVISIHLYVFTYIYIYTTSHRYIHIRVNVYVSFVTSHLITIIRNDKTTCCLKYSYQISAFRLLIQSTKSASDVTSISLYRSILIMLKK